MIDTLNQEQTKKLIAIALRYCKDIDGAPRVIASGQDEIAKKIITEAQKAKIPIKQNADLASILALVKLNDYIPFEAFYVVAKILAHIYKEEEQVSSNN